MDDVGFTEMILTSVQSSKMVFHDDDFDVEGASARSGFR
jgi:hypothetical protein